MSIDLNSLKWTLEDQRLNVHAYPASNVGAAIGRLMHVGFKVTNGYQDGNVRMAREHVNGNGETFCFVKPDGRVGPMLLEMDMAALWARRS